mgnify:CR=1 FL=1
MITHLKGILHHKSPTEIVVDVHGVGYIVSIPLSTFETLPEVNAPLMLLTHFIVREDVQQLYGFATEAERDIFRLLISVSGIGPKIAQTILSGIRPADLQHYVAHGNVAALTSIPGVGKKTAERLIVELRDKIAKLSSTSAMSKETAFASTNIRAEALAALVLLGYNRERAEQALRAVLNEANGKELSIEELLKRALQTAGK